MIKPHDAFPRQLQLAMERRDDFVSTASRDCHRRRCCVKGRRA